MKKRNNKFTHKDIEQLPGWAKKQIKEQLETNCNYFKHVNSLQGHVLHDDCIEIRPQHRVDKKSDLRVITIDLPLYMLYKGKNIYLGLNIYRNNHWSMQNRMKKFIANIVKSKLKQFAGLNWEAFAISYKMFFKNKNSDAMNCISFVDKALVDALQKLNIVTNDRVLEYLSGDWCVVGQSKDNPKLTAVIKKNEN